MIDGFAERCSAQQEACKTEEGRAEMGTMARSRRDMATAIRALALPAAATDGDADSAIGIVHERFGKTIQRLSRSTLPIDRAAIVMLEDMQSEIVARLAALARGRGEDTP